MAVVVQPEITGFTGQLQQQPPLAGSPSNSFSDLTSSSPLSHPVSKTSDATNYDMYYTQDQPGQVARRRKRDPFTFSLVVMAAGAAAYVGYKRYKAGRNPLTNKPRNSQNALSNMEKGQSKNDNNNKNLQTEQLYQSYQRGVQHGQTLLQKSTVATVRKSVYQTKSRTQTQRVVPPPASEPEPTVALDELTEDQRYQMWKARVEQQEQDQSVQLDSQDRERSAERKYSEYLEEHERREDSNEAKHHIAEDHREERHRLEQQQDDQTTEYSSEEQRKHMDRYEAEQAASKAPPKKGFFQKAFLPFLERKKQLEQQNNKN
uniref:Uncharacterized protein n=1 Tax=Ditylenchus dipsaci TaxID=166011 RepID=A0A915CM24_9BILA